MRLKNAAPPPGCVYILGLGIILSRVGLTAAVKAPTLSNPSLEVKVVKTGIVPKIKTNLTVLEGETTTKAPTTIHPGRQLLSLLSLAVNVIACRVDVERSFLAVAEKFVLKLEE